MLKRICSMTVLTSMFLSLVSGSVFAQNTVIDTKSNGENDCSYEVFLDTDFENQEIEFSMKNGQASLEKYDDERGNVMSVPSATFYKEFSEPVTEGMLYFSFDALRNPSAGVDWDVLYNCPFNEAKWLSGTYISGIYWAKLSYAKNLDVKETYEQTPYLGTLPANEWFHYEYWYDMDNRITYAYINGEEYFVTGMKDDLTQINAVGRISEGDKIDNCKIVHFKDGFDENVVPNAEGMPGYVKSSLCATIETGKLGNNYFTKDIEFDIKVNNSFSKTQKAEVTTYLVNESGIKAYSKTDNIEIAGNSAESIKNTFTAPEYGFYDAYVTVKPENGVGEYTIDTRNRISCIKQAEQQNPKMATSDHWRSQNLGMAEVDRKMELFKNVGMSVSREELHQQYVRQSDGSYTRDEVQLKWQETGLKYGISPLVIFEGEGLPTADNPTKTADFAEYVKAVVTETKGTAKYFEVGNEPNFKAGFNSLELAATNYLHACKVAYETAKEANPDCEVMAVSLCEYHLDYVEAFLAAGGGKYMDGISIHPYMLKQAPENGGMYEKMVELKELMKKYGCEDKKIYITEIGWSEYEGYTSERQKNAYMLRTEILIGHEVDLMTWYNAQYKDYVYGMEEGFGFIYQDGYARDRVPYGADMVLLSISHWNSLMYGSEFKERIECEDDDIRLYKYKLSDGRDVIAAYNIDESTKKNIGLDLGVSNAEVRDMYGNAQTTYTTDGTLSLALSYEPIYIIGNFAQTKVTDSKIDFAVQEVDMIAGETTQLTVKAENSDNFKIEVDAPEGFEVKIPEKFQNGMAIVTLRALENSTNGKIGIKVKNGESVVLSCKCDINYSDPVSYTYKISPYGDRRSWVETDFTNHRAVPIKLELKLNNPTELAANNYTIEEIEPYNTRRLRLYIPNSCMTDNKINFNGTIVTESANGGGEVPFDATVTPGYAYYTDVAPKIDGYISNGEWKTENAMKFNAVGSPATINMTVTDAADFSGKGYLMCDDDYVYFGAEITDDVLYDGYPRAQVYNNDSIQVGFAQEAKFGFSRTELSIGLCDGKTELVRHAFMGNKTADEMNVFAEGTETVVRRDEVAKKTYYEIKLPWSECYDTEFDLANRKTIAFSVCINENDGLNVNNTNKGGRGYYEYIGGIGSEKNALLFVEIPIIKK